MNNLTKLLGFKAHDKVTGFAGVITSVCIDLYGCRQVLLNPGMDKDGKLPDQHWFDVSRLQVSENQVMSPPSDTGTMIDKGPAEKPRARAA